MPGNLPILLEEPAPQSPLPTVEALDRLWASVASRPLWAPPNLGRYLKLRWRMKLRFVSRARLRVSAPSYKVNDCASCTDICCIGPRSTVLLRLRDIATLVDVGRTELITQQRPEFSAEELAARPALERHVGSHAWQIFPVLRQTSAHFCAALTREGKCSLYPHWPLSCARFPYSLHTDLGEVFYSPRCPSFLVRQEAAPRIEKMIAAAVASYNERIKDAVLLAYARPQIEALGLTRFLRLEPS